MDNTDLYNRAMQASDPEEINRKRIEADNLLLRNLLIEVFGTGANDLTIEDGRCVVGPVYMVPIRAFMRNYIEARPLDSDLYFQPKAVFTMKELGDYIRRVERGESTADE